MGVMVRVASHALAAVGLVALAACAGPDHAALAAYDHSPGSGGQGGTSGNSGADGAAVGDAMAGEAGSDEGQAGADGRDGDPGLAPDGPSVLTLVNGLVDAPAVRVCFHSGSAGTFAPLAVQPLPTDPAGLGFAKSLSCSSLPGGIDLTTTDVRPVVYAGDLAAMATLTCDALNPLPNGVRETPLQVLPAGTLASQRSVLVVLAGCVGGPGHDDSVGQTVCGSGYSSNTPNATLLAGTMTRAPVIGSISIQAFAGSLAAPPLSLRHLNSEAFITLVLPEVPVGAILPRPPDSSLSQQRLGNSPEAGVFELYPNGYTVPTASFALGDVLAQDGMTVSDFADGRNFTVVWVGGPPGSVGGSWWQPFRMLVVRSDP